MPIRTLIIVLLALAALAGCGRRGDLEPPGGTSAAGQAGSRRPPARISPLDPGLESARIGAAEPGRTRAEAALLPRLPALGAPPCITSRIRAACSTPRTCRCRTIAAEVGTPFYCYSTATLTRHYRVFDEAFAGLDHLICYSLKANSNQAVIATLARLGAGADVVSEGELRRALAAGIPPEKIVFSGVGKTARELAFALEAGIHCFNVESEAELRAAFRASPPPRRGGARLDPHQSRRRREDARQDLHRSQGEQVRHPLRRAPATSMRAAAALPGIRLVGIDTHIGSQLTELEPFDNAFGLISELVVELRADGHAIEHVDLGGGLGIPYRDDVAAPPLPTAYAEIVRKHMNKIGCRVLFEPGRLIAGNAGILVTEVIYVKEGGDRTFVIVDAAMNDLVRPTLYDAYHRIGPVTDDGRAEIVCDVVGPVCETGDFFARGRALPRPEPGDLLAIYSAGAYGAVQAGTYNSRLLVPEVLVNGDRVRRRPPAPDLRRADRPRPPAGLAVPEPALRSRSRFGRFDFPRP